MLQAPTGAGKTRLFATIIDHSLRKGHNVWTLVPRKELLDQASDELIGIGVKHGRICPGHHESGAFNVHVVSKDTLIRRYDKIKKPPSFIIIDEAHLALDRYIEIQERYPDAFILGCTATPERLDGRGLSDLYEDLVMGPSIKELIELGFLSEIRYFCPPTPGIENLHRVGTDYNADELGRLLEKRKIYGKAIEHYRKHAHEKPALAFCRNIAQAEETAQKFSAAGYRFENIDGSMPAGKRKMLIDGLRTGELHGLTSCELLTYGLDVPRVECIIMLRPTLSKTIFFQSIGRGLRPYEGKDNLIVLDHVGNLAEHGHPLEPQAWMFHGREKRGKRKSTSEAALRLCPEIDFLYCDKPSCAGCPHDRQGRKKRKFEEVDVQLKEVKPIPLPARPAEERKIVIDRINECVEAIEVKIEPGPVKEMLEIGRKLGYPPMWVYNRVNQNKHLVNMALLHEISRQMKYAPGWAWVQQQKLKGKR